MRVAIVRAWPVLLAVFVFWAFIEITTRLAAWLIRFFSISS